MNQLQAVVEPLVQQLGLPLPWEAALGAAGGLVLLLFVGVVSAVRTRQLNGDLPESKRTRAGRRALVQARKLEGAGDLVGAADAYVAAGRIDTAVPLYVKADKVSSAADALIAAGQPKRAADQYRKAGKHAQAGRLYKQVGSWALAAEMFDEAGQVQDAAAAWEQAGELAAAGERYLAEREYSRAARAFERAGAVEPFLDAFVPWWEAELEKQMGRLEPASYWMPAIEKAVNDAVEAGKWEAALKLASYVGRWDTAARAAEELKRFDDAKRFYESIQDLDGIARMAELLGENDEAAMARGEAAEQAGERAAAAEYYEQAGSPERALDLWWQAEAWPEAARVAEGLGRTDRAAEAWRNANEPERAAPLLAELERWAEAGSAYEDARDHAAAAGMYRKAEQWADAARMAGEMGDSQAAIRDLQTQLRTYGQNKEHTLQLVEHMMMEGMQRAALGLIEPLVTVQPKNETDAAVLYNYGMLLEELGRVQEAAEAYDRIMAFDLTFRDARERGERLRNLRELGQGGSSLPTQTPSSFDQTFSAGPDAPADASGDTQKIMDRYQPRGELGRGGMGVVIKAHDKLLDRMVALKMVRTPGMDAPQLERLLKEARATAKLNHPNIVQIYDCALAQNNLMMAMEYVEGQTLKDLIDQAAQLPVQALVLIFGQIAKALFYAHEQGIVHRDIKPANVLWTKDKQVKITDFGLARAAQELANTQTVVVGTPYYMAPEQLMGDKMDHRVDLYALGISMFEACTGSLPFPKGDVGYHHIHTPAPDPREWRSDLPEGLSKLILDLMAKKPEDRPADAGAVLDRLKSALQ